MNADLRRLAEQATPHPAETRAERLHRFHIAASPRVILALLDERDECMAKLGHEIGVPCIAERRVAALREAMALMDEEWPKFTSSEFPPPEDSRDVPWPVRNFVRRARAALAAGSPDE